MKAKIMRILSMVLIFTLTIGLLTSCSKPKEAETASKENRYKSEEIIIPSDLGTVEFMLSNGESIYLYAIENNVGSIVMMDFDGNIKSKQVFDDTNGRKIIDGYINSNGEMYLITASEKNDGSNEDYFLLKYNNEGNLDNKLDISDGINNNFINLKYQLNSIVVDSNEEPEKKSL